LQNILPSRYEVDAGVSDRCLIRRKKRFRWKNKGDQQSTNLQSLITYHNQVRQDITPIFAPVNSWYMKKNLRAVQPVEKSQLPLLFAAMHRLSELSRYDPITLARHLDAQHNWILTEFLQVAPAQFINNIACEITGKEFVKPYAVRLS
jgi:YaaC-like Protein